MPLNGSLEPNSIYISLNARPKAGEYHWGVVLTDSDINPTLHHASNRRGPWVYEEREAKPDASISLIVLVKVDKAKDHARATDFVRSIPADGSPSQRTGEAFTCRIWVKDVLMALHQSGEIRLAKDIDVVENEAVKHGLKYASRCERGRGATVINDAF